MNRSRKTKVKSVQIYMASHLTFCIYLHLTFRASMNHANFSHIKYYIYLFQGLDLLNERK